MMKIKFSYPLVVTALCLVSTLSAFISIPDKDDFALAKREISLRMIGHELLLHSGDKTSRVMPVQKLTDNTYRITFEQQLSFEGDSLRAIVNRALKQDQLAADYIVNVRDKDALVFGYAKSAAKGQSINACSGRLQPRSRYVIDIKFKEPAFSGLKNISLFAGLPFLAFVGLIAYRGNQKKRDQHIPIPDPSSHGMEHTIQIGNSLFNQTNKTLVISNMTIQLSTKESRLLEILAKQPNSIVERSKLQKEIWEDEGVIVGRSLDMFISRLRKKLEADKSLSINNIHGKGYKLAIV
jgi:hypothetical protein